MRPETIDRRLIMPRAPPSGRRPPAIAPFHDAPRSDPRLFGRDWSHCVPDRYRPGPGALAPRLYRRDPARSELAALRAPMYFRLPRWLASATRYRGKNRRRARSRRADQLRRIGSARRRPHPLPQHPAAAVGGRMSRSMAFLGAVNYREVASRNDAHLDLDSGVVQVSVDRPTPLLS